MFAHEKIRGLVVTASFALVNVLLCTTLAFASHPGRNGRITFLAFFTGVGQIYTINPDGTDLFQVRSLPPANDVFALWPDFSPDGERIVFAHDMTGALEVYVINADGTGLTQITHDGTPHALPRWSPDGTHILFSTNNAMGVDVVAAMRSDGTDVKILSSPVWGSFAAVYRADGAVVFESALDGFVSAVWIMDARGRHSRRVTAPALEAGGSDISPDGSAVVCYNNQNTPKPTSSIFKVDVKSGVATRLTGEGHIDTRPAFSPDGRKILFMSDRRSPGVFDMFMMNADGSDQKLLVAGGLVPNWGPAPQP